MDEAKPMTSVFYDVIRLEAVRGDLNVPIEGHFWRFLGNLNPKILSAIMWTPKKALAYATTRFEPSCVKFHAQVTSVGEREALYFTYFARHTLTTDWHKFWVTSSSRGRHQLCKVLSVKGFGFCEGSKFDHSHWTAMSPLTLMELTFPLWYVAFKKN